MRRKDQKETTTSQRETNRLSKVCKGNGSPEVSITLRILLKVDKFIRNDMANKDHNSVKVGCAVIGFLISFSLVTNRCGKLLYKRISFDLHQWKLFLISCQQKYYSNFHLIQQFTSEKDNLIFYSRDILLAILKNFIS